MRIKRQRDHKWWHTLLKILFTAVLLVGVSFSLAWVWQTTEYSVSADQQTAESIVQSLSEPVEDDETEEEDEPDPDPSQEEPEDEPSEEAPAERVVFEGAVPESEPVDNSYFDDAIFIGDSITTGIPLYHVADNAAVVAMSGISPANINEKQVIKLDEDSDDRVTILEACATHGPRAKVYVMLGGNGLGYTWESFINGYETFLRSLKELYPGAIIYLQSITPVTGSFYHEGDPEWNNAKIDQYNLEIMALAKRENVYYLDVASALKDETGALPEEASPVDGLHLAPLYYDMWFDYLKSHTVEGSR